MRRHRNRHFGGFGWLTTALAFLLAVSIPAFGGRDGNGGYTIEPVNAFSDPVTGGTLTASDADAVWRDLETAIAGSVAADGQTTMSGDLKMGANQVSGMGEGSAATDATTVNQVQDNAMSWGGVAGGTADALTLSLTPSIAAYVDGMTIWFVSSASPNTGATTLAVNSVATDAILKNGAALAAGDIAASKVYAVTYYNSDWHLWSPFPSGLAALATANTFTAAQTISGTTAATLMTVTSTEAGATEFSLDLHRNSATPADSDVLAGLNFIGEDDGSTATTYAKVRGVATDVTNATEDGQLQVQTIVAGTAATRVTVGAGVFLGSATGGDPGAGSINADTDIQLDGVSLVHGLAQMVSDTDSAFNTTATALPYDDTIPQNTEGEEVLSVAITPKNASSTLKITVSGLVGSSGTTKSALALFVDTTADALDWRACLTDITTVCPIEFTHVVSAGSTAARTYKVRYGSAAGTGNWLGTGGSRVGGGAAVGSITVEEVLP